MSEEAEGEEGLSRHFETAETTETMLLEKNNFFQKNSSSTQISLCSQAVKELYGCPFA